MEDVIKIVKSLEDSGLLLKGVTETVQNEVKEEKGGFLRVLLGTLGASLLGNILAGKGINRAGEGIVRAGYGNKNGKKTQPNGFSMSPHPLTNFEIQRYYQNESRFNGVYSRDNITKIKGEAYVINLDEYSDTGTHWVVLYVRNTYSDSFGVEHIPKEVKAFIDRSLSITTSIFRIQVYNSIICGYFCIRFIDFMLAGKTLTEFTNLFSPNDF